MPNPRKQRLQPIAIAINSRRVREQVSRRERSLAHAATNNKICLGCVYQPQTIVTNNKTNKNQLIIHTATSSGKCYNLHSVMLRSQGPGERCGGPKEIFGRCGVGMWCQQQREDRSSRCHGCYGDSSNECYHEED